MSEDFLHYIWKHKLFNLHNLRTEDEQEVMILQEGFHNHNSGPDFSNAKIQIGDLIWAGNVEIHINSSDWFAHNHQEDPLYQKTILHVVWVNNKPVSDHLGNIIPTIILKGRVSNSLISKFDHLILNRNKIMCSDSLHTVNDFEISNWLGRLLIERLERKVLELQEIYQVTKNNWEQTFFISFCKNFGFKTNAEPMLALSRNLNFIILLKNKDDLFKLESLLFGVAGLLDGDFKDEYFTQLKKEFTHQKSKYGLQCIPSDLWKFGKIRPIGFPTLRLSQLAHLIHMQGNLFDSFVREFKIESNKDIPKVNVSSYWETHYTFDKESKFKKKPLGTKSIENLLINTVSPMLFFYGKEIGSIHHQELAIDLLEKLPAENNFILRNWSQNNIFAESASDSQSLIELTNRFCTLKKCLNCGIGKQILNK